MTAIGRLITALALLAALVVSATPSANATPTHPDLSGFLEESVDPFITDGAAYFQAPDGMCAILPSRGIAGCDSARFPGTYPEVNEIVLSSDPTYRGLHSTTDRPTFVKAGTTPELHDGQKIVDGDIECAVGPGPRISCTKGFPVAQWMVISPGQTGVGSTSAALPDGFPNPDDFVLGSESYIGYAPGDLSPVFTVGNGLTCTIRTFPSGQGNGDFGCDGPLPGVPGGENEVLVPAVGPAGIRRTNHPQFATRPTSKPVLRLPNWHRVHQMGVTCMTSTDAVACFTQDPASFRGFIVSPGGTMTFDE